MWQHLVFRSSKQWTVNNTQERTCKSGLYLGQKHKITRNPLKQLGWRFNDGKIATQRLWNTWSCMKLKWRNTIFGTWKSLGIKKTVKILLQPARYTVWFKRTWSAETGCLKAATTLPDCSHIPQLQSHMWFVDTLSLFYVSRKVGSATLMCEAFIIEFIAALCHQPLIWVVQHPLSPPQSPDAPSVSAQIEQECFPRSQLSEYRVQLFCGCRHFLSGLTAFVSNSLFVIVLSKTMDAHMKCWALRVAKDELNRTHNIQGIFGEEFSFNLQQICSYVFEVNSNNYT